MSNSPLAPAVHVLYPEGSRFSGVVHGFFENIATSFAAGVHAEAERLGEQLNTTVDGIATDASGLLDFYAAETITLPSVDAAGRLIEASYQLIPAGEGEPEGATAYLKTSAIRHVAAAGDATGFDRIARADSYGLGVLIADALERGATTFVLDVDEVPFADAGTGILTALGCQMHDASGLPVAQGLLGLADVANIDTAQLNMKVFGARFLLISHPEVAPVILPEGLPELAAIFGLFAQNIGIDPAKLGPALIQDNTGLVVGLSWLADLTQPGSVADYGTAEQYWLAQVPGMLAAEDAPETVFAVIEPQETEAGATTVEEVESRRRSLDAFHNSVAHLNTLAPTVFLSTDSPEDAHEQGEQLIARLFSTR